MKREHVGGFHIGAESQTEQVQPERQAPRWSLVTRVALRFCVAYFGAYSVATQIFGDLLLVPNFLFQGLGPLWPMRQMTFWIATNVFHVTTPLAYTGNSLDTNFFWVQTFWLLVSAVLVTSVWSVLDRRRHDYVTLHKWFRLVVRLGLASQMFKYGMPKVIPTQMPAPSLLTLVQPVGHLSLQGLFWTSIGASPAYQIFTGIAEVLGGLLLLVPRTTMLGALVCLAELIQVFMLNITYDIGVKIFSFHLTLMTVFVLAPELPRLVNFFFLDRPAGAATHPCLFPTSRANRMALAAQIVFGFYLLGAHTWISWGYWYVEGGGGSPKSALYGIWDVDQLAVDGQIRSPLLNDYDRRWRRVIFDSANTLIFQRTDESFARYGVSIDIDKKTLALTKGNSKTWSARFAFQRPAQDRLILDGDMDTHKIHMQLQLVDFDSFRLLNSSFRWVRPPDP